MDDQLVWMADRDFNVTPIGGNGVGSRLRQADLDLGAVRAHLRALEREATAFDLELGDRVYACHVSPLYGEDDDTVGSFGVGIDVTAKRRSERSVAHAERMQAFALVAETVGSRLAAQVDDDRATAEIARALATELLSLSRTSCTSRATAFCQHVRSLLPRLERLLGAEVRMECDVSSGSAEVAIEPSELSQIVLALVANARDAMPDGGTCWISTRTSPFEVTLIVRDDGLGMERATLARALDPYFTTKEDHRGLGLTAASTVVRACEGSLTIESAPGAGTRVEIGLPAVSALGFDPRD